MKLTKQQLHSLMHLAGSDRPVEWRCNNKAMGHKLMKMGLAKYSDGYPIGFVITDAGRQLLKEIGRS